MEDNYKKQITSELKVWQHKMSRRPNLVDNVSKLLQNKMNSFIPEKIHRGITVAIKQMVRAVLFGSKYIVPKNNENASLFEKETKIVKRIKAYKKTAAVEGGITGAGGIFLGLVDFPVLLGLKFKLLFDIATLYGFDVKDYKERLYILQIFQLAFSSQHHRQQVFEQVKGWNDFYKQLPGDIHEFDWRHFQQEYRDHIDLAKMAQLIPGIGAVVGLVVNYQMIKKLGYTAMNAYRMRLLQ